MLLQYLAMREGEVVSRSEISKHLYGTDDEASSNVVDVYIGYLRNKIDKPFEKKLIHTRRGAGYQMSAADGRRMTSRIALAILLTTWIVLIIGETAAFYTARQSLLRLLDDSLITRATGALEMVVATQQKRRPTDDAGRSL